VSLPIEKSKEGLILPHDGLGEAKIFWVENGTFTESLL